MCRSDIPSFLADEICRNAWLGASSRERIVTVNEPPEAQKNDERQSGNFGGREHVLDLHDPVDTQTIDDGQETWTFHEREESLDW